MTSDESFSGDEFTPEQWERISAHIRARGMTFEVFLPESQADWLRAKIAAGVFNDAKAAFVAFKDLQELDQHPEVRRSLLNAMLQDGIDSGPGISMEEFREQHRARLREYANSEPPASSRRDALNSHAAELNAEMSDTLSFQSSSADG
jgi:Arc/MetJ-type ribon-helix-helix transcriptional regulator